MKLQSIIYRIVYGTVLVGFIPTALFWLLSLVLITNFNLAKSWQDISILLFHYGWFHLGKSFVFNKNLSFPVFFLILTGEVLALLLNWGFIISIYGTFSIFGGIDSNYYLMTVFFFVANISLLWVSFYLTDKVAQQTPPSDMTIVQ